MAAYGDAVDLGGGLFAKRVVTVGSTVVTGTLNGVTPGVIAAAGDYAQNDVVSDSVSNGTGHAWVFPSMAADNGRSGQIVGAIMTTDDASVTATFRLWLFDALPSASELDDNAAFSLAAADQSKLVGIVDFAALAPFGGVAGSFTAALSKPFKCASADTALYGILQVTVAMTNEAAGMLVLLKLLVTQG